MTLCVINFNGAHHLETALAALAEFREQFDEILVLDNASTDNSLELLVGHSDVKTVCLARNGGPGAARNAGFRAARNNLILFQDNDVRLNVSTASRLAAALRDYPQALVAAPRVLYAHDPDRVQYDSADCHLSGMMLVRNANVPASDLDSSIQNTSSLITACFMLDRSLWRGGQLFDETLLFNLEDHDLGVRACILGHDLLAVPSATVLHGSGTPDLSWRPGYQVSSTRMFCLIRNRWWIILRYFSLRSLLLLLPLLVAIECLQLAGMIMKGFGPQWLKAVWSTLKNLPRLLVQRSRYQRMRTTDDRDILKSAPLPPKRSALLKARCSGTSPESGTDAHSGACCLPFPVEKRHADTHTQALRGACGS